MDDQSSSGANDVIRSSLAACRNKKKKGEQFDSQTARQSLMLSPCRGERAHPVAQCGTLERHWLTDSLASNEQATACPKHTMPHILAASTGRCSRRQALKRRVHCSLNESGVPEAHIRSKHVSGCPLAVRTLAHIIYS